MLKASEIMTRNPATCQETDTVHDAVRLMREHDVGVVPIVNENLECSGIITDRDIAIDVVLNDLNPRECILREVMNQDLLTCHADDALDDVLHKMEQRQVKRILVVDEEQHCIGIISEFDIVQKQNDDHRTADFVEGVYSWKFN